MFKNVLIWLIFFKFLLYRERLTFWWSQTFGCKCTCHTSLSDVIDVSKFSFKNHTSWNTHKGRKSTCSPSIVVGWFNNISCHKTKAHFATEKSRRRVEGRIVECTLRQRALLALVTTTATTTTGFSGAQSFEAIHIAANSRFLSARALARERCSWTIKRFPGTLNVAYAQNWCGRRRERERARELWGVDARVAALVTPVTRCATLQRGWSSNSVSRAHSTSKQQVAGAAYWYRGGSKGRGERCIEGIDPAGSLRGLTVDARAHTPTTRAQNCTTQPMHLALQSHYN